MKNIHFFLTVSLFFNIFIFSTPSYSREGASGMTRYSKRFNNADKKTKKRQLKKLLSLQGEELQESVDEVFTNSLGRYRKASVTKQNKIVKKMDALASADDFVYEDLKSVGFFERRDSTDGIEILHSQASQKIFIAALTTASQDYTESHSSHAHPGYSSVKQSKTKDLLLMLVSTPFEAIGNLIAGFFALLFFAV